MESVFVGVRLYRVSLQAMIRACANSVNRLASRVLDGRDARLSIA
jgi:hypothetical protein